RRCLRRRRSRRRIRSMASSSSRSSSGSGARGAGRKGSGVATREGGGGAAAREGAGGVGSLSPAREATRAPQPGEKGAVRGGSGEVQLWQRDARASPQEMQKLAPGAVACPHAGQCMLGSLPMTPGQVNWPCWAFDGPTAGGIELASGGRDGGAVRLNSLGED